MIDRVETDFALKPERLIGDMAYGNASMLAWLVDDKGIEPHVPVWDKTQRTDGTLSSSDFVWDEEADEYRRPQGQPLRNRWRAFQAPRGRTVTQCSVPSCTAQAVRGRAVSWSTEAPQRCRTNDVQPQDSRGASTRMARVPMWHVAVMGW